jgi:hypothetical protein
MIGSRVIWKESIGKRMEVRGTIVKIRTTLHGEIFEIVWDNGGNYSFEDGHVGWIGDTWSAEELELTGEEVL